MIALNSKKHALYFVPWGTPCSFDITETPRRRRRRRSKTSNVHLHFWFTNILLRCAAIQHFFESKCCKFITSCKPCWCRKEGCKAVYTAIPCESNFSAHVRRVFSSIIIIIVAFHCNCFNLVLFEAHTDNIYVMMMKKSLVYWMHCLHAGIV